MCIRDSDSAETGRLEMVRGEGELRSIFSATAEGNLDGVYYTYEAVSYTHLAYK